MLKRYLLLAPLSLHSPSEATTRSCLPSMQATASSKTHLLVYVLPSDPQTGRNMAKQGQSEQPIRIRDL